MLELVSKGQDYVKKRKRRLGALWTEGEQGKAMRTEPLTRQTTCVSLTISGICLFIQRRTSEQRAAGSWQHHIWFQHRVRWRAGQIWGLGARETLAGVHFTSWRREVTGWEGGIYKMKCWQDDGQEVLRRTTRGPLGVNEMDAGAILRENQGHTVCLDEPALTGATLDGMDPWDGQREESCSMALELSRNLMRREKVGTLRVNFNWSQ